MNEGIRIRKSGPKCDFLPSDLRDAGEAVSDFFKTLVSKLFQNHLAEEK